ncbi:MAG: ABC transporter permease subunit [Actinomycetota bacterium]|nr:ABC transporter permease subunit [Actinomycetota bacterium]
MTVEVRQHAKTPLWRNVTVLKWTAQIFILMVVGGLFLVLASTALRNFERADVSFGWGWLSDPPGVQIREGIDLHPDSGARALLVGIVNTFRIAISGIVAATILGTLLGIGRLSSNWIVKKISTVYVETFRNVPLLVLIFFWSALAITLPGLTEEDVGTYFFKASNRGFAFAWIFPNGGFWPWLLIVAVGLFAARYVARRRRKYQDDTGRPGHSGRYSLATLILFSTVGWFAWPLLGFMQPVFGAIESLVDSMPAVIIPTVIGLGAIAASVAWIRNFFESRRTPAGFGKITDDDWFRVIFAGVSGIAVAYLAFTIGGFTLEATTGEVLSVAELLRTGMGNFFGGLATSFSTQNANQVIEGVRSGGPLVFERPIVELRGSIGVPNYGTSGMVLTIPFFAIWIGVTLYAASFIAEIVRGGVLAVPLGQTEAAKAVGLKRGQLLRMIILPQAFRIILPPMGNQYLNLAKNTSLGLAVAYADIVAIGTTLLNQTGQSLPVVVVWMSFFITVSLSISAIVNYYNRKMQLVER